MSCSNLSSCSITASDCFLELNGSSGIADVIIASAVGSTLTLSRKSKSVLAAHVLLNVQ